MLDCGARRALDAALFKRFLLLTIFTLCLWLPARPGAADTASPAAEDFIERHFLSGGRDRFFLVLPPADRAKPASVVVLLHGGGQSMHKMVARHGAAMARWPVVARLGNTLLLIPNGTDPQTGSGAGERQHWNDLRENDIVDGTDADDVGFILDMLDWAGTEFRTDADHVFVTGASNGGMMVFRLLIEAPSRFAAGAAFIAALPDGPPLAVPAHPVPLMIANATDDPLIPWAGGTIGRARGKVMSALGTRNWWVAANRATTFGHEFELLPDLDPDDGCRISVDFFPAGAGGAPVLFSTMIGSGHAAPTRQQDARNGPVLRTLLGPTCHDAEAVDLAWDFFMRYGRGATR